MIEPLLLTTTRVSTFFGQQGLTAASGFFFERDRRLFLVTSRHVLFDQPSGHFPNRIELNRAALPASVVIRSFTPAHLQHSLQEVEVGTSLLGLNSAWYADILMTLTAPAPSVADQFLP